MSHPPETGLLSHVADLSEFQQSVSPEQLLAEARKIIDNVDPKIVGFLSNFTLRAQPPERIELPQAVVDKLDGAPRDLLNAVARYVYLDDLSDGMRTKNLVTLAGFVSQRFTAVSLVAESKRLNGETNPIHLTRHAKVLESRAGQIEEHGGNVKLGQSACSDLMSAGCFFQKAYMTSSNETAQPIARRLQSIGITL